MLSFLDLLLSHPSHAFPLLSHPPLPLIHGPFYLSLRLLAHRLLLPLELPCPLLPLAGLPGLVLQLLGQLPDQRVLSPLRLGEPTTLILVDRETQGRLIQALTEGPVVPPMLGKLGTKGVHLSPELVAFLTQVEPVGALCLGLRLIGVKERHAMRGVHQGRQLALEDLQLSRDQFELIQI